MKSRLFKTVFLAFVFSLCANSYAQDNNCTLSFRPKIGEMAFSAVGSSLKIADRNCQTHYLYFPESVKSGAIDIPKGLYRYIHDDSQRISFSNISLDGQKVKSCIYCDPIKNLFVKKSDKKQLCALSIMYIESCAKSNSIRYEIKRKNEITEGVCTTALVYSGRSENTLSFAVNDCSKISKPTLRYDLKYGNVIRFLDEQFIIYKADNLGIYYSRLNKPNLKANDIVDENSSVLAKQCEKLNSSQIIINTSDK